jgi:UPF0271 protein
MPVIDFNCDLGEGIGNDALIMPYISSANIACGYHAGDADTMAQTVALCLQHNVAIGAHPSYADRKNFGRTNQNLAPEEIYRIVQEQIQTLVNIAKTFSARVQHVKPHGALYNRAAKDTVIATAIAKAVKNLDLNLFLLGLPASEIQYAAEKEGLRFVAEAFADRTYQPDGSLTPRTQPNALIEDEVVAINQVLQIVQNKTVTCIDGKIIPLQAATICIHGDGKQAIDLAKALYNTLTKEGIIIQSFNQAF